MNKFVAVTVTLAAMMIGPASAQDRMEGAAVALGPSATTDPQVQLYRYSGVRDDGGATNTGVASVFHCTNFSGVQENLRIQIRNFNAVVARDNTYLIAHNQTFTMSTHNTGAYAEDSFLDTNALFQGSARIWATTTSIVCTASTIDAAAAFPNGIDLHGIRFNPIPGTQE